MNKMNIMSRYIHLHSSILSKLLISMTFAGLLLCGCHDDVEFPADIHPEMVESGDGTITSFTLEDTHFTLPEETRSVMIALISRDGDTGCYNAEVEREAGKWRFHMNVPADGEITDGDYVLTLRSHDGRSIPGRLVARFENGLMSSVSIILPTYMLDGSGTEEDPYLIQNDEDFEMFLMNLGDDKDAYGAGLKFLQTADVKAPDQSSFTAGRGYWGAPFAGIYDGGNHAVSGIFYLGTGREDSDSFFGLFTDLRGTASVSHLSVTGVTVSGLYKWSGIIAGHTTGNVTLTDISVAGVFADGYAMGGLVGVVKSGSLTVKDVELHATIKGGNDIGGLVGRSESGTTLTVTGVTTQHFSVTGEKSVGGIVGRTNGTVSISDVRLEHKVSAQDSDIKIICGNDQSVGGIIGHIDSSAHDHALTNCYVLAPVGSSTADCVGGIIGEAHTKNKIKVNECRFYSVLEGRNNVGGFAGKIIGGTVQILGDDLSTRIAADDADAKITGVDNVGGFVGRWECNPDIRSKVKINLPITATGSACGGVFGRITYSTVDITKYLIGQAASSPGGDTTMKIAGNDMTGGVVGCMTEESKIYGADKFDYPSDGGMSRVPSKSQFSPIFSCVVTGNKYVGGLVGYSECSTIRSLSSAASVTGNAMIGGIVGGVKNAFNVAALEDCAFMGALNCPKASYVGGIVGYAESYNNINLVDCINYSPISGGDCTGGIAGYVLRSRQLSEDDVMHVEWCVNMGEVSGTYHVGGIVGRVHVSSNTDGTGMPCAFTSVSITDCMNTAKVYGAGGSSAGGLGGIVGFTHYLTGVMRCANHGDIYGEGVLHGIGGIAGSMGEDPTGTGATHRFRNVELSESCNTGTIDTATKSNFVGGILGYQEEGNLSDVEDCHNLGKVLPQQSHDCGGIVGCVDHLTNIYRCVNQGKVEHGNAAIGTHKSGSLFDHGSLYFLDGTGKNWPSAKAVSAAHFTDETYFSGLDFESCWMMTADGPALRNNHWRKSPVK